jgi:hypothetical protein
LINEKTWSANPWKLLSQKHIDHSLAADCAVQDDLSWMVSDDLTDDGSFLTIFPSMECGDYVFSN